ncbi:hypothetical protein [Streptomyces niveus]|uniref:Uncharacterized protein n=1 Tax=Streptomyces niveus TaxID=193462 RepID=A0ABZ1ZVG9_STRNV|nr:hypothetical protein [Streptomyces niveus]WTA63526.1 hypothetical protein OG211_36100 [Streptomyces niveus]
MDADRAERLTAELRARGVMAHLVHAGVYEFGIRVVLDDRIEALWDMDGAAGLDAEIVNEGALIGFVPHVPGSEEFTEEQMVNTIATTNYALDTLQRPADRTSSTGTPARPPDEPPHATPPALRRQRRAHWLRRGRR